MSSRAEETLQRPINALFEGNANLKFTVDPPSPYGTALQLIDAEQGFVLMSSTNPPGNPFGTNNLYVFQTQQGGLAVPTTPAIASASANSRGQTNIPRGSVPFGQSPYLIAYSLNPAVTTAGVTTYPDVVATTYIPAIPVPSDQASQIQYSASSLGVATVQGYFITFSYAFPPGFDPTQGNSGAGAWIGIWQGQKSNAAIYNGNWDSTGPIQLNQNSGTWPVSLTFPIATSGQYTAALYTSGWSANPANLTKNNIAAWIYFSTHGLV